MTVRVPFRPHGDDGEVPAGSLHLQGSLLCWKGQSIKGNEEKMNISSQGKLLLLIKLLIWSLNRGRINFF